MGTEALRATGGDSGGPWITSNGAGQATAHGQTFGALNGYCTYIDVNYISSQTQSSLVTY